MSRTQLHLRIECWPVHDMKGHVTPLDRANEIYDLVGRHNVGRKTRRSRDILALVLQSPVFALLVPRLFARAEKRT